MWSAEILGEVTEHLIENVSGFTAKSGERLVSAMNTAFPYAEVEVIAEHYQRLEAVALPDEGDRHVLAAAVSAEATVLCTANTKDFPDDVVGGIGVEVMTPDALLCLLVAEFEPQMLAAHASAIAALPGATDESTIAALQRAGAPQVCGTDGRSARTAYWPGLSSSAVHAHTVVPIRHHQTTA